MVAISLAAVAATAPVPGVTPTAEAVPGVPAAPTTLYTESFENRAPNSNLLLTDYTGASGMTYSGDPFWVSRANCNGFIINRTSPIVAGDCGGAGSYDSLTALPHALGLLNGAADPSANAAAAAYTSADGANGLIEFRTAAPLSLPSGNGRFVTFSVDAAAVNCWAPDQPMLRFYLVDGNGVEQPVSSAPINPCTDAGGQDFAAQSANGDPYTVRAGSFVANGSMLMTGSTLGIVMRNEDGGGFGNDGAYDNIRVLDVTPTLDKAFSPTTVNTGGTSTLTFTITNTDELGSKDGWSFTDALPAGLTIAPGNTSTTCPSGTITAPAGGASVAVSGNLDVGMTSCTATVNVTSDTAGTYTNGPDNVTATGLNPPGSSSVEFLPPTITVEKMVDGRVDAADQFTVGVEESDGTVLTSATTSGTDTSVTSDPADVVQGTTYTITDALAAGSVLGSYDKTAVCTGADTATTETLPGAGPEWTFTPNVHDDWTCTVTNTAKATTLELLKEAGTPVDMNGNGITDTGDTIAYTFTVTNTGEVTMDNIAVNDPMVGSVTCAQASLEPEEPTTCAADNLYTVTADDVTAGSVVNTATASGTPPGSTTPVTSNPSSTTTPTTAPDPELQLLKSANPSNAAAYRVGQVISYSFVVSNSGNVPMEDVTVDETAFSGSGSMSAVSCPETTLAVDEQMTCTASYTLTQDDINSGSLTNTAIATGTAPGSNTPTPSDPSTVTIPQDPEPALTVAKSSDPSTVTAAGEVITYSFLVTNTGNVTINAVAVAEQDFSGTGTLSAISCPDPRRLIPGESTTCSATYTVTQEDIDSGPLTNAATATGNPPSGPPVESPEDTATVTTPDEPELSLEKRADPALVGTAGDVITYSFLVSNTGNVTIENVAIDEGDFTGTGAMSAVSCPTTELAPDASTTCTATYTLTQADVSSGSVTNTATATGTPPSGTQVISPPSTATVTVAAPALTVDKNAVPATVGKAGDAVTYTFLVTNTGNVTMTDIAIDEGAFSGTGQLSAITCPATSLAASAQMTCTATYAVTQADVDKGDLTNTATVTGTPPVGPPVESPPDTATVTTPDDPGLSIVKTASPTDADSFKSGAVITYSFVVTNTGNVTMAGVRAVEQSFTGSGSMSAITCPAAAASVAPGDQVTCTATYTVTQADVDAGGVTNVATGTGTPPSGPPETSPPSEVKIPEPAVPTLSVVKTADTKRLSEVGQEITYSFLVTNTGNVTIKEVAVDEGAFTGSGELSPVACPAAAGSLAPGEQVTCSATYTVVQADLDKDSISNTATATGTPPSGPEIESPPDTVNVPSTGRGRLGLVKTADAVDVDGNGTIEAGDRIEWTITVSNTGTATVRDITVSDPTAGKVTCPRRVLRPGRAMTCTVRAHTVTAADMAAGEVRNTAVASGVDIAGESAVVSDEGTATTVLSSDGDPQLPDTGASPLMRAAGLAGGLALLTGALLLIGARRRRSEA